MNTKNKLIKRMSLLLITVVLTIFPIMSSGVYASTPITVEITNPIQDKFFRINQNVDVSAEVSDTSKIEKVDFYEWHKPGHQSKKIGEDTAYPYTINYTPQYFYNDCGYSINYVSAIITTKDNEQIFSEYKRIYVFDNDTQKPDINLSVAKWKDDKKAAYSPTYDDCYLIESHKRINTIHKENIITGDKRDIKGTLFWDTANANWDMLNRSILSENYLTMGSHTVTHPYDFSALPLNEMHSQLANSQDAIYKNTGKMPLTYAYPRYIVNDNIINVVNKYYIAARWGSDYGNNLDGSKANSNDLSVGINDYNTTDYYKIKAMCPATLTPATTFDKWLDQTIEKQGWLVTSMHGVNSLHPGSWKVQDDGELNKHYEYTKTKIFDGSVWNDSFENVSKYLRERNSSTLESTNVEGFFKYKYNLSIDDKTIDENLKQYLNFPLTLKFKLPNGWKGAYVTQGSKTLNARLSGGTDGVYVIFDAVPQNGEIVIGNY